MDTLIEAFICYDSNDSEIAKDCRLKLEQAGISANIDSNFLHAGDDWDSRIDDIIRNCDVALLILTDNIKDKSYVFKELDRISAYGIPLIPFAPEGFGQRSTLTEAEKRILLHPLGNGKTIGGIQHTNRFDEAIISLQQKALEHKMAPKGRHKKRGTSAKEFIQYMFTGYLKNTKGSFNLLFLYQYPKSISTRKLIQGTIEKLRNTYANSSFCIVPLKLPETADADSMATLRKCLCLTDGVVIFDVGEAADYTEVVKWSERRENVNKPVMRYVPPEIRAAGKQSGKLKIFEEIEDLTHLSSLLRIASIRSNKSLQYLRHTNTALLYIIAALIISAIFLFFSYNQKEKNLVASTLTSSGNISDFIKKTVFGSTDNRCDLLFFTSTPNSDSIFQFLSGECTYTKNQSIIGAAMRGVEKTHFPFYIVWERNNNNQDDIIFAARKVSTGGNAGKFVEIPKHCITKGIKGTWIGIENDSILIKYQTVHTKDNHKLLVACYAQLADEDSSLYTGLSFELGENQYSTAIKDKLTDIDYLYRIEAAAKLLNWINVYHETLQPVNATASVIKRGIPDTNYNNLKNNLSTIFGEESQISVFYAYNDSAYYLKGEREFSLKNSNIGAAMQLIDWCISYDNGQYSAWKKSGHNSDKIDFHKQNVIVDNEYVNYEGKEIKIELAHSSTISTIKTMVCTAIERENKIMGISVHYNKSGFDAEQIKSLAERAYAALEIVFDTYGDRIPEAVSAGE